MTILEQLAAIARNTFYESVRQPVVLVVLVVGTLMLVMSIPFSAYTLMDDQRMFIDIALSSIFVCGAVLASFLATSALSREIDNKTALTVVSKPVSRPVFACGKWLGVALSLTAAISFLSLVFMLTELHGTMQTVATPYHQPVLAFGIGGLLLAIGAAVWANYFYSWAFPSACLAFGVPVLAVAYALCLPFGKDWSSGSPVEHFHGRLWVVLLVLWIGLLVLAGIAVAASTRLGQVMTLIVTMGFFVLGLMSDWLFGRPLQNLDEMFARLDQSGTAASSLDWNHVHYVLLKLCYWVVPNFQVLWLSDAAQQGSTIPGSYVARCALYGVLVITAALSAAVMLFQRREVG